MKLKQSCPCGGAIEVAFDNLATSRSYRDNATEEARKRIDKFVAMHRDCVKRAASDPVPKENTDA